MLPLPLPAPGCDIYQDNLDGSSLAVHQPQYKFSDFQNKQAHSGGSEAVLALESEVSIGVIRENEVELLQDLYQQGSFSEEMSLHIHN